MIKSSPGFSNREKSDHYIHLCKLKFNASAHVIQIPELLAFVSNPGSIRALLGNLNVTIASVRTPFPFHKMDQDVIVRNSSGTYQGVILHKTASLEDAVLGPFV